MSKRLINQDTSNYTEEAKTLEILYHNVRDRIEKAREEDDDLASHFNQYPTVEEIQKAYDEAHSFKEVGQAYRDTHSKMYLPTNWLLDVGCKGYKDTKKFIELWNELCDPNRALNSSYNPSPEKVYGLAVNLQDAPVWVKKQAYIADAHHGRTGSHIDMFDAAKAWDISPLFWKPEAIRVGQMPVWKRIVAAKIIEKIAAENGVTIESQQDGENTFRYSRDYDYYVKNRTSSRYQWDMMAKDAQPNARNWTQEEIEEAKKWARYDEDTGKYKDYYDLAIEDGAVPDN